MPTEVNRSGMEEVEGISARVLHVTASFGIQDPEESLGNVPGIGIGALDRATCYTCSAAVTIHVSVVPFESACARNLHCPVLSLVRVPNTLIRVAILRDGDTARPQRRIVGLIAGQVRASEVPLIVSRAHVIVLTRTAVFAAALKPYVQSSWIGESGWIVSYVHVLVQSLRIFVMPAERIRCHEPSERGGVVSRAEVIEAVFCIPFFAGEFVVRIAIVGFDLFSAEGIEICVVANGSAGISDHAAAADLVGEVVI